MVIAALLAFVALLIAWIIAPNDSPTAASQAHTASFGPWTPHPGSQRP